MRLSTGILLLAATLTLTACTGNGNVRSIRIDPSDIQGMQYMPDELGRIMESLDYQWVPISDPNTGNKVRVAEYGSQYRMRFRHRQYPDIQVDAHMMSGSGITGLYLTDTGPSQATADNEQVLGVLLDRLRREFGNASISADPLLPPP